MINNNSRQFTNHSQQQRSKTPHPLQHPQIAEPLVGGLPVKSRSSSTYHNATRSNISSTNTPNLKPTLQQTLPNQTKNSILKMTKSYNFNINSALDYTCHRLSDNQKSIDFCGKCNSCQIINNLNGLKQWFDRASYIMIKKFLSGLVFRINNLKIYKYLNDLLKPLTESKDFVYARNKIMPSLNEDHLKATNNRCLDTDYIEKQINDIWSWYSSASNYVKLNFMLSLLNKCEQATVFIVIINIQNVLDSSPFPPESVESSLGVNNQQNSKYGNEDEILRRTRLFFDESESEMVCDAFDAEEEMHAEDDNEVQNILNSSNDSKHVDFIRQLPVYVSKRILNSLNKKSLYNCLFVCKYWSNLIKEVHREGFLHKILLDDMMLLKGTSSKGSNPKYANNVDVKVPNLYPGSNKCKLNEYEEEVFTEFKNEYSWENAYKGYSTRNVIMEERNLFCGAYNVLLLKEKRDPHRVIHFNGSNTIAFGSFDKKLRFIDLKSAIEKNNTIQGHAGSIKCVYICEPKRVVITGSYDTSIRCWSIDTNKCIKIFQGHQQTVTCLSMYDENDRVISGSNDKTCKIWQLGRKKCWRTFKHLYAIVSVAIGEEICITGGSTGKIKVFNLETGNLIKTISAHQSHITSIKFDRWHILSCGTDGYAIVFSTQGKHKKGIIAMRHPKEVLCLEFKYLRAITGSADGKIRIWNILNGDCIRVMRGNSRCDPILSITTTDNRILINTEFNILLMEFEQVIFEYGCNKDDVGNKNPVDQKELMKKNKNYSSIRASRSELVATPNVKLFNDDRKSVLEHSSRPISGKNLKDANLVNAISSKATNLPKNSIGNLSESALLKRQFIVQAINDTIISRTSLSVLSNHRSASNMNQHQNYYSHNYFERDDLYESSFNKFTTGGGDPRNRNLYEAKLFLRDQLKELKQNQQSNEGENPDGSKTKRSTKTNDPTETESCVETRVVNRDTIMSKYESSMSTITRPSSSPSKYDTKTKIKGKPQEYKNKYVIEEDEKYKYNLGESSNKFQTQTLISKVFESSEKTLQTNNNMHPVNVKSKLPNPIVIRPQTVSENSEETRRKMKSRSFKITRSKTANQPLTQASEQALIMPTKLITTTNKLVVRSSRKTVNENSEIKENNRISSHDNLNLMTFKDVDRIVETINSFYLNSPQKTQEQQQADLYKKIWMLKSTGQYHGSLLVKQSSRAPEIRE